MAVPYRRTGSHRHAAAPCYLPRPDIPLQPTGRPGPPASGTRSLWCRARMACGYQAESGSRPVRPPARGRRGGRLAVPVTDSRGQSGGDRGLAPCRSGRLAPVRVLHQIKKCKAGPSRGRALGLPLHIRRRCAQPDSCAGVAAHGAIAPCRHGRERARWGSDMHRRHRCPAAPGSGSHDRRPCPHGPSRPPSGMQIRGSRLEARPSRHGKQARTSALRACPAAVGRKFPRPGPRPTVAVPWPWRARVSVCPVSVGCACARPCAARAASWP